MTERRHFYDEFLEGTTEFRGLVVDYGCGDGYFGRYMFPRADVVGVDPQATKRGINIPDLLLKADFLVCSRVLQQVPEPLRLLSFLKSHLRPRTPAWLEFPIPYKIPLRASFELQEALSASSVTTDAKILEYRDEVAYFSVRSAKTLANRSGFMVNEVIRSDRGGALALRAET